MIIAPASQEGTVQDTNEDSKPESKPQNKEYDDLQPSDDDDFPDEQEIFNTNGFLRLQNNISAPVSKQ